MIGVSAKKCNFAVLRNSHCEIITDFFRIINTKHLSDEIRKNHE